jgi:hypothetical protein
MKPPTKKVFIYLSYISQQLFIYVGCGWYNVTYYFIADDDILSTIPIYVLDSSSVLETSHSHCDRETRTLPTEDDMPSTSATYSGFFLYSANQLHR